MLIGTTRFKEAISLAHAHQLNQIISHFQGNTKSIVLTDINIYQSKPKIPINIFYNNQNDLQFLILPHPTK